MGTVDQGEAPAVSSVVHQSDNRDSDERRVKPYEGHREPYGENCYNRRSLAQVDAFEEKNMRSICFSRHLIRTATRFCRRRVPARAGEVDRGHLNAWGHRYGARPEQGLLPIDEHAQGAVGEARGNLGGARALEAMRVLDGDNDAVLDSVEVGGEERKAGDVCDFGHRGNRGRHCERKRGREGKME